ncbi:MAG: hypothetical protein RR337_12720 [Clostridia bacterium]
MATTQATPDVRQTVFEVKGGNSREGSQVVRIDRDVYNFATNLAYQCRITLTEVVSRMLRDAIPYTSVCESKLYEFDSSGSERRG